MRRNQQGFSVVEGLLILVIVGILGFTGWFVWHARQTADKTLSSADKSAGGTIKATKINSFEACKKASGSKMLETYPEQCVAKDGKTFTDPGQSLKYISIKEWGVKLALPDADKVTYKIDDSSISISLKSSVTSIESCQDLNIGIIRDEPKDSVMYSAENTKTVAEHTYRLTGNPQYCDEGNGVTNGPINQLRERIARSELTADTLPISAL
jgi:Tfp pilus assembly protein PilV